jgi:hypothetical protein
MPVTDSVPPTFAPAGLNRVMSGFSSAKHRAVGNSGQMDKQPPRSQCTNGIAGGR